MLKHLVIEKVLFPIGYWGARDIGSDTQGNGLLKLNKASTLGIRGDVIAVPRDSHIFNNVLKYSVWGGEEHSFITEQILKRNQSQTDNVLLLDLGAHCGLISRQVLKGLSIPVGIVCVEAIPEIMQALSQNLKPYIDPSNATLLNVALGCFDGRATMYKDLANLGNSSLNENVVDSPSRIEITVEVMSANRFSKLSVFHNAKIYLKSDLQGNDAEVLSGFSTELWNQFQAGVIEVMATQSISKDDVSKVIERLKKFKNVSYEANLSKIVDFQELEEFWLSGNMQQRNLFFS